MTAPKLVEPHPQLPHTPLKGVCGAEGSDKLADTKREDCILISAYSGVI
jgi:hypothetical protein